jgi:hypothetical protein
MSGPYDQSTNRRPRNAIQAHIARPFKRAVDLVRDRVEDLSRKMHAPAFLDQYPANAVPHVYSLLYKFDMVSARRNGSSGFEAQAEVVDLGKQVLPYRGALFVNREGPFYWLQTNAFGYTSLTYQSDPANGGLVFRDEGGDKPVGDIFDPVIGNNGGAETLNYFFGSSIDPNYSKPCISWDVELFDTKRSRRLHESNLPPQVLTAQGFANKKNASPIRLDPNTDIEARVRLLEVRPGSLLNTGQAFDAATTKFYLNLVFVGYKVLEV